MPVIAKDLFSNLDEMICKFIFTALIKIYYCRAANENEIRIAQNTELIN